MRQAVDFLNRVSDLGRELAGAGRQLPRDAQSCHPLIQDLDALDPRQRRELACALAMLWEEFVSETGGDAGYQARSLEERDAYLVDLSEAAHQVRDRCGTEKLHFALAADLMVLYAELLAKPDASRRDRRTAARIAEVAALGQLIRRAGHGAQAKARRWLT